MQVRHVGGVRLLVLIVGLLLPAATTLAQGTSGTLPNPINTPELDGYAQRLTLSEQQRTAVNGFHENYQAEFLALREGDIASYLQEMRQFQMGVMPSRDQVVTLLKRMDDLAGRIAALDKRFFDRVQTILTDTQLALMPRVRRARERARYLDAQIAAFSRSTPVDLSELMLDIELSETERTAVDPALIAYETKLTTSMRKLKETSSKTMLRIMDELEERGFTDKSMQDPEVRGEMMKAMQEIMQDLTRDAVEQTNAMHRLSSTRFAQLQTILSPANAVELHTRYVRKAYAELADSLVWYREAFEEAMEDPALSAAARAQIAALEDRVRRDMQQLSTRSRGRIDEMREERGIAAAFDASFWQDRQELMEDIRSDASKTRERLATEIGAVLGADAAVRFSRGGAAKVETKMAVTTPGAGAAADGTTLDQDQFTFTSGADQFLPPMITRSRLRWYAEILELDDRTILEALHDDYRDQFKAIEDREIDAVLTAQAALWKTDPETGAVVSGPSPEQLETVFDLRRRAMAAIRRVDEAFMDEIGQVVLMGEEDSPRLERIRLMRERESYSRGHMWDQMGGDSAALRVDLVAIIRRQDLHRVERERIADALLAYERTMTTTFRERYDRVLEAQLAMDKWSVEAHRMQQEGDVDMAEWQTRYREFMADSQKFLAESNIKVREVTEATLDAVSGALGPESGPALRDTFHRIAHPEVFVDATCVRDHVDRALALDGLAVDQRSRLQDLAASYLPAYAKLCDDLIDANTTMIPPWTAGDNADWSAYQEREDRITRIKFDRNELNSRAANQLATVLSSEQIEAIGGLPR